MAKNGMDTAFCDLYPIMKFFKKNKHDYPQGDKHEGGKGENIEMLDSVALDEEKDSHLEGE